MRNPTLAGAALLGVTALFAFLLGPLAPATHAQSAPEQRFVFERAEMGVPFRITLYAADAEVARGAAEAALARVAELNAILSDYDSDSEISRLSRTSGSGRAVPVSGPLWTVLERSQWIAEHTDGAFDVTLGPLINLWRRTRRLGVLPIPSLLAEMQARTGYRHLVLHPGEKSIELRLPEMRLDVGGIAKGYAADEALAVLKRRGLPRALVAASGDLVAGDPPPGQEGWKVEIESLPLPGAPPAEILYLKNQGVSTAGDAYQFVEIDGVRYSHIIDPHTGLGLTGRNLVTVVAPDGLTADGLDTAIEVLGPAQGLRFATQTPNVAVRYLHATPGGTVETHTSAPWASLPRPTALSDKGPPPPP